MPPELRAFAPGRVNLIGEHTDYNRGLALPFAIAEGVTVSARATPQQRIRALALDLGELDEFELPNPPPHKGWRAFVRGIASELLRAGIPIPGADLEIRGEVPRGAGLSSSAALEVSLGLALLGLAGAHVPEPVRSQAAGGAHPRPVRWQAASGAHPPEPVRPQAASAHPPEPVAQAAEGAPAPLGALDRRALAKLCSRVESEWAGARTGLLDQLASLFGEARAALCIDFSTLAIQPVPLRLEGGWRLVTLDSGERRALADSGYNKRRAECAQACELLGVDSLRQVDAEDLDRDDLDRLPDAIARRVRHVLDENARVLATVAALREGDLPRVGALLDASHASLRDLYECSTPAVEATVEHLKEAGAAGARMVGGGFGGHVLGLFPPAATPPAATREVSPSRGAHLL